MIQRSRSSRMPWGLGVEQMADLEHTHPSSGRVDDLGVWLSDPRLMSFGLRSSPTASKPLLARQDWWRTPESQTEMGDQGAG